MTPNSPPDDKGKQAPLSAAGWVALAVAAGLSPVPALWYAVKVWSAMAGVQMSGWGWLFPGPGRGGDHRAWARA